MVGMDLNTGRGTRKEKRKDPRWAQLPLVFILMSVSAIIGAAYAEAVAFKPLMVSIMMVSLFIVTFVTGLPDFSAYEREESS